MSVEVDWGRIPKSAPLSEFLLMEEVSELTRIPMSTLRFYRHSGKGGPPSFKLSGRVVYRRAELMEWIEQRYARERAVTSNQNP